MKTKITRLFLSAVLMMCCTVMANATNPDATKIGNIYYILDDANKTAEVTYTGESADDKNEYTGSITIPSTVSYMSQDYSVTSIGNSAFYNCSGLTLIIIPGSVANIGADAFDKCTSLTLVTIPEGVTSIGEGAFYYCSGMTLITIPESVTSIGGEAFNGCSSLKSITIPSGIKNIEDYTFAYCSGLTYLVVLATTPPSVGFQAFWDVNVNSIPVYVPNVNVYKNYSWGGFTNFKGYDEYKNVAITEIEEAKNGVKLTDADQESISRYIDQINNANDLAAVASAKSVALAIINLRPAKDAAIAEIDNAMNGLTTLTEADRQSINSYKTAINEATTEEGIINNKLAALAIINLQKAKDAAIAEIQKEMQGETGSAYLNGLVENHINAINAATDENIINSNKESAISKIKEVIDIYKEIKSAEFGEFAEMRTPRPGTAVKVTKGEKEVILYAPDKVEYIIRK